MISRTIELNSEKKMFKFIKIANKILRIKEKKKTNDFFNLMACLLFILFDFFKDQRFRRFSDEVSFVGCARDKVSNINGNFWVSFF